MTADDTASVSTAGLQKNQDTPPRHVAIIMDGNGRWATREGVRRSIGHKRGSEAVREAIEGAIRNGVDFLTLYAFFDRKLESFGQRNLGPYGTAQTVSDKRNSYAAQGKHQAVCDW